MEATTKTYRQATVPTTPKPSNARHCPVCGGPCHPLGGAWRCTRCRFSLCDGCDGEVVTAFASGAQCAR